MSDFNSKYTGNQVEALLDIVSQGGTGGGGEGEVQKTTEAEITAMGFTKNLGTITEVKMNGVSKGTEGVVDLGNVITEHQDISGKVDKVTGKGLSTEDFTSALKSKLEGLKNYDDTEISNAVSSLQSQINTLVSGNANDAINSFNEIIAFLEGVKDTEDLASIIASIEQQIASKYTKPSGGIPASDLASDVFLQGEKGDKGDKGDTGPQGPQGPQGIQGEQGPKGDQGPSGTNGATFTPSVDANGNLSWTNDKGLANPPTVNIKGPKGDSGEGGGGSAEKEVVLVYGGVIETLLPNKIYIYESSDGIFDIQSIEYPDTEYAEYHIIINARASTGSASYSPTIILPSGIAWANGAIPDLSQTACYELSIVFWLGTANDGFNAVITPFNHI